MPNDTASRLAACARLLAWLTEHGGVINGIAPAAVKEPVSGFEHIGIRATRDIKAGDELLRVPRSLTIDVTQLVANETTHLARRPQLAAHFPSREGAVLLSGLIEAAHDDFRRPYYETLPTSYLENPGLWWSMPGTFSRTIRAVEEHIISGRMLNVSGEAAALGKYIRDEHSRFVQAYSDDSDDRRRAAVCGPRSFSWAMLTAATRGLRHFVEPQGLALVPVLDLFNHDATPHVEWNLTGPKGEWVATAVAAAAAGEQLFIDYGHPKDGQKHEQHFTASYGFSHVSANRLAPPAGGADLLSETLSAARALAEEEAAEALRASRWPRSWPPSPYRGWLWCESCPASLEDEGGDGGAGDDEVWSAGSDGAGWQLSDACRRQAMPFGDSRAGSCYTLGADCPPPRRRRPRGAPAADAAGASSTARRTPAQARDELR